MSWGDDTIISNDQSGYKSFPRIYDPAAQYKEHFQHRAERTLLF